MKNKSKLEIKLWLIVSDSPGKMCHLADIIEGTNCCVKYKNCFNCGVMCKQAIADLCEDLII